MMKLKKIILVVFIAASLLTSCSKTKNGLNNYTTIIGTYNLTFPFDDVSEVTLSKIVNGENEEVATYKLGADKKYGFTISTKKDEEGFYVLTSPYHTIPLYIKNNQLFEIDIQGKTYTQTNFPDEENELLYNWVRSIDTLAYYANFFGGDVATYREFFPFYKNYVPKLKEFHKKVNTSNENFNELLNAYIDLTIEEAARHFLLTPRDIHPTKEQVLASGILEPFEDGHNFKTTKVLKIPGAMATLTMNRENAIMYADKPVTSMEERIKIMTDGIENDTIKALFISKNIRAFKNYKLLSDFIKPYKSIIAINKEVENEVNAYLTEINVIEVGSPGYDFEFNDVNDKKVSFKSLRGNIVYIDMWAMWCAPCKAEIPALKQLEKDFHGKDIRFVSISLDKPKQLKVWKKFVKEKELGGIQLIADNAFRSNLARSYKVNSIPRFLLFDKEGNIISLNATRPSNPATKQILLNLLKK